MESGQILLIASIAYIIGASGFFYLVSPILGFIIFLACYIELTLIILLIGEGFNWKVCLWPVALLEKGRDWINR